MPDSIGIPDFLPGEDVDYIYVNKGMKPEEVRRIDREFFEKDPELQKKVLETLSAKMEPVDAVSPRAVHGGSQGLFMTPTICGVKSGTEEVIEAGLRYLFPQGALSSEERDIIDEIARSNPN